MIQGALAKHGEGMKRIFVALSLVLTACGQVDDDSNRGPSPTNPPVTPPTDSSSDRPSQMSVPKEVCNGVDDDGSATTSERDLCLAACTPSAVAAIPIELPTSNSITVAGGSGITPELTAVTTVPSFCTDAPPGVRELNDTVDIGCGTVYEVDAFLSKGSIRVASGGVLRVTNDSLLVVDDTILVCPEATIQAGIDAVSEEPSSPSALDAHRLNVRARKLLLLGTLTARGGVVLRKDTSTRGRGGDISIDVERLLLAGLLDTTGDFRIVATKESFVSGTVQSTGAGSGYVNVPVL